MPQVLCPCCKKWVSKDRARKHRRHKSSIACQIASAYSQLDNGLSNGLLLIFFKLTHGSFCIYIERYNIDQYSLNSNPEMLQPCDAQDFPQTPLSQPCYPQDVPETLQPYYLQDGPKLEPREDPENDWTEQLDEGSDENDDDEPNELDSMSDDSGWESDGDGDQELRNEEIAIILQEWHNDALEIEQNVQCACSISFTSFSY